jgi:biotin-(acetyl-CoA carboxylase) ligase
LAFSGPDRILVNGGLVGGVRFAAAEVGEGDMPAWAVIGVSINVLGDPADTDPGRHPDRTTLREEGFGDLTAVMLLESFARHLLSWMDLWENDGDAPVHRAWAQAAAGGVEGGA